METLAHLLSDHLSSPTVVLLLCMLIASHCQCLHFSAALPEDFLQHWMAFRAAQKCQGFNGPKEILDSYKSQ